MRIGVGIALGLVACGHGGAGPAASRPESVRAVITPQTPPQYIVADPANEGSILPLPLGGNGVVGLVVDKTRIIVGRGEPRLGEGVPEEGITGAVAIPARLGGGFLFWTDSSLYRSTTFDGALEPIAKTPDPILNISFAPKFLLVRSRSGERWALGLPKGERVALDPLGVVDVEGLDDGRALAFDDQGHAMTSTDGGSHWADVTTQLKNAPTRVAVVDGEIWFFENNDTATRLEPDGQLSFFDKPPNERARALRTADPRWRGADTPLRQVFRAGASIDDSTAIVIEQGDIVRVDVHTGEIQSVLAGKLPPEAFCQGIPTPNDVLFACIVQSGSAFVVSRTLGNDAPFIEQSFSGPVGQFWSSDDGGLAYPGPCASGSTSTTAVCVRQPSGSWQELDLSALNVSGGVDVHVDRWVPRGDGRAIAIITEPSPSLYDPRSGASVTLDAEVRPLVVGMPYNVQHGRRRPVTPPHYLPIGHAPADSTWSFSPSGSLRGWSPTGVEVEITEDGKLLRSPYSFELAHAGPNALGRSEDGRYYQSTDHGASWVEVLGPPSGAASGDLRSCSSAGCDLGGFYRVGWTTSPPRIEPAPTPAKRAPEVHRTRPVELSCHATGPAVTKVLPRTENSPEDLGLGQTRVPVAGENNEVVYLRATMARGITFPIRDGATDSDTTSLRAMLTGYGTSNDSGTLEVMGPNRNVNALRRSISFWPAFDPLASLKKSTIAMYEVLAAGRLAGMTTEEVLQDDMTESGALTVMTPHDPLAPSDLVFKNPRGMIAFVHANERVRVAVRASAEDAMLVSGVALGGDDAAFLELESNGAGHVFRVNGSTTTDLYDVNASSSDASLYPANPDALAVGPKGELGIVRTGSGSEPASAQDPAFVVVPQSPATPLAPWSTLRLADDPACKEPGWRTTVQAIAPWIRMTAPELHSSEVSPMLARVKWNDKRVCLEGIEMRLPDVSVRAPNTGGTEVLKLSSWLVSRGSQFSRVAIAEGAEYRQPMECVIKP